MDIFFKPRIEADGTEQHGHFAIQESKRAQNRVQVTCIITVCSRYFLYQFYFTPENPVEGLLALNLLLPHFFNIDSMSQKYFCLKCSFSPNLYWILIGKYLGRYFLIISS